MRRTHVRRVAAIALAAGLLAVAPARADEEGVGMAKELAERAFAPLPLGAVRPAGWLERQLRIQADGLSGHLDEFWPDVMHSGWIGGDAEGWERMPYWLDGVVPLAYLLDDAGLKAKVGKHMDYILEHQHEDGWLGPQQSEGYKKRDPWPVFVMLKVLAQYHEATGDERVVPAMRKFLWRLQHHLAERPLFDWNKMRWQDLVWSIHWLYERSPEVWLLELAETAEEQGYDWLGHFENLPFKERVGIWQFESHVVNNAMGVKTAAVWRRQTGEEPLREAAHQALAELDTYHGQATGLFTGDECFAGKNPSQGTELCAVVEYLFSLELLMAQFGDPAFGDRLERIAFNALPATFSPDMWAHQYDQQANQVVCKISKERVYTTNGPDANIFGLEPNYGCCTANMHQGWPKFAAHLWMGTQDGGFAAVAYAPSSAEREIGGQRVRVALDTEYPFEDTLTFTVHCNAPAAFPLALRVPDWPGACTVSLNGGAPETLKPGAFHRIARTWEDGDTVVMTLAPEIHIKRRYNDAATVHRGPLVFALDVPAEWKHLRGEKPHADYELHPKQPWNYAVLLDGKTPELTRNDVGEVPFSPEAPPLVMRIPGRLLSDWGLEKNAAAPPPQSPVTSQAPLEDLRLIPYGCAKLRVTELPVLEE